jgi:hypothetical protein
LQSRYSAPGGAEAETVTAIPRRLEELPGRCGPREHGRDAQHPRFQLRLPAERLGHLVVGLRDGCRSDLRQQVVDVIRGQYA